MAHSLTTGMLAQTLAEAMIPAIFCEVDTPGGNAYMWSGVGNLSWNSQTWSGLGELGGISPTTETTDLQANGVTLSLNGFDATLVGLAMNSLARFYPVKIWLGALDTSFNVIADPYEFHSGLVDSASIQADGKTAALTVTSETRLVAMSQARERRYTDQDQRIECPGDGGFKFVDFLQNAISNWGGSGGIANTGGLVGGLLGFVRQLV